MKHFVSSISHQVLLHGANFLATSCIWITVLILLGQHNAEHLAIQTNDPSAHRTSFLTPQTQYLTCGKSVQEAKSRGCQYDILTNHWMPNQCSDDFGVKEYQSDGTWLPFGDGNRTKELTVDELGDLPFYYTSMRDHVVHCAMLWKRQFRALSEGWKYVDSITVSAKHTGHCADFLMEKADVPVYRQTSIKVFVGSSGCHVRDV